MFFHGFSPPAVSSIMWMTLSITEVSGGYRVWFALRMESHRPFFLNYIILSPLFLTLISQWKLNEKAIGSPFYYCHLCFLSREVRLPDLRGLHFYLPSEATSKEGEKTITGKVTISIIKKLTCHTEHVWNLRAAGMPALSTCFWGLQSVTAWWWLSLPFNLHYSGRKKVPEETRIPDGGREGGADVRLREKGCRWERRIKMNEVGAERGIRGWRRVSRRRRLPWGTI